MYGKKSRYENLQHGLFDTVGKFDIPKLEKVNMQTVCELISFNYVKSEEDKSHKGVHFFIDDYQFARVWNHPEDYINTLSQFGLVLSPDFSLYADFPKAMQIYNHYRKHWLGAYWQSLGMTVVPTVCWSDEKSFEWCFDGEPVGGTVAVSSIGTQTGRETKKAFLKGYNEMMNRLKPETIIFYGHVPKECAGNIIRIKAFQENFRQEE